MQMGLAWYLLGEDSKPCGRQKRVVGRPGQEGGDPRLHPGTAEAARWGGETGAPSVQGTPSQGRRLTEPHSPGTAVHPGAVSLIASHTWERSWASGEQGPGT